MRIIKNWILMAIIIFAVALRLWHLGSVPPALTPDEAALGYNAYSILHTGRDEYGKLFPILFKSFGDYKPGFYVYLTVPSVALLGLNEFSTRLPSALFGILSVYLIFLIVRKLFDDHRELATIAAFIAATNPYLIYFSRGAWEANVSLTLTLAGIYFFLRSLEKSQFIIHSLLFFALTLLTYQGAKLSTAIVVMVLICVYWSEFWRISKKYLFTGIFVGFLVSAPIIISLFNGQAERLTVFSIFSYHRPPEEVQKYSDSFYYLFHSEPLNYVRAIAGRWFNVFSGKFLFFEGDTENPISTAPYQGVLLLSDLLLLPLGLYAILKNKLDKGSKVFLIWLILAPLSAAISRDTTNAVRSLNVAVSLVIVISFGAYYFLKKFGRVAYILAASIYLISLTYFADAYFIHVPAHNSNFWRYGYKQIVETLIPLDSKYKKIVVEQSFNQPYIYFLFYGVSTNNNFKMADRVVLEKSANIKDVGLVRNLGNIKFQQIDWQVLKKESGTLVVASPVTLPPDFLKNANLVKEIKYLNGRDIAFEIIEMK